MTDLYFFILLAAIAAVAVLQILLLLKKNSLDWTPILQQLQSIEKTHEHTERLVRDEISKNREESSTTARESRVELAGNLKSLAHPLSKGHGLTGKVDPGFAAAWETLRYDVGAAQRLAV